MPLGTGGRHWIGTAVQAVLVAGYATMAAALAGPNQKTASLPADIVAAWKKAGAKVGWLRPDDAGFCLFRTQAEGKAGEVPAFAFDRWQAGLLDSLPQPEKAFGLSLNGTALNDAGLKELARFKSLQVLDLPLSKITGAGFKEFADLRYLRSINLFVSDVTDAGLKEVARLKSLHSLHLGSTYITDVGLKELAGMKWLKSLDLSDTKATNAGVAELRKALPGLRIYR